MRLKLDICAHTVLKLACTLQQQNVVRAYVKLLELRHSISWNRHWHSSF